MQIVKKINSKICIPVLLFFMAWATPAVAYSAINCNNPDNQDKLPCNPIVRDINTIVNFLSVGVGLVVIAMLIVGGIQYSIAGDNPQALTAAKQRITNALIALAAYLLTFSFLQWLIPGGVF